MRVIIVTGSRRWEDYDVIASVLASQHPGLVIHGDANGADRLADSWAKSQGIPVLEMPANWACFGSRAGALRNRAMIEIGANLNACGHTVIVLAFPMKESIGTRDCMRRAVKAGLIMVTTEKRH